MELEYFLLSLLFFIIGLILGSFFNVLIYRLPQEKSIVFPGSFCPKCNRPVRLIENIPLLSYIFLGGRCAGCKERISLQYPIVEFVSGIAALTLWHTLIYPYYLEAVVWWEYICLSLQFATLLVIIPIFVIDYYHYIIPDSITLSGLVIGIAASFIPGGITPLQTLIGVLTGGGTLLLIGLFGEYILRKKDSMGGGDIKLMAFIGAVWGWKIAILAIILGALFGSVIGVLLIVLRILPKDHRIPFGPFLGGGVWIAFLWGDALLTAYFAFIESLVQKM